MLAPRFRLPQELGDRRALVRRAALYRWVDRGARVARRAGLHEVLAQVFRIQRTRGAHGLLGLSGPHARRKGRVEENDAARPVLREETAELVLPGDNAPKPVLL